MSETVTLTLTRDEVLDLRQALLAESNAAADMSVRRQGFGSETYWSKRSARLIELRMKLTRSLHQKETV